MPTLIKFLTGAGHGSRRVCFQLIAQGKVTVNGIAATGTTLEIFEQKDVVMVEGRRVDAVAANVYLKINKPLGVVSAVSDARGQRTVSDLVPEEYGHLRLFPVGRLDKDSTGLILMTNDGDLAYHLTHPKYEFEKEYHFLVDAELDAAQIDSLQKGVMIEGQVTVPSTVSKVYGTKGHWYSITLREGRKRQVRRMLVAVGNPLRSLRRVRVHTLRLGELSMGEAQALTKEELAELRTD
jgi:23S rRNA pseudouridine2605 synthase